MARVTRTVEREEPDERREKRVSCGCPSQETAGLWPAYLERASKSCSCKVKERERDERAEEEKQGNTSFSGPRKRPATVRARVIAHSKPQIPQPRFLPTAVGTLRFMLGVSRVTRILTHEYMSKQ